MVVNGFAYRDQLRINLCCCGILTYYIISLYQERMEEERQQFSQKMRDARKRFEHFLLNIEKSNPFLLRRTSRGSIQKNSLGDTREENKIGYKRLSCNFENPGDAFNSINARKARSFSKRSRPMIRKNRFRHSVIGTGKEFSDLEELIDASKNYGDYDSDVKLSPEDAFQNYFNELYTGNTNGDNAKSCSTLMENEIVIDNLLQLTEDEGLSNQKHCVGKKTISSWSSDFDKVKTRNYHRESLLPFLLRSKLAGSSQEDKGENGGVVFSKEQKRRLKKKMKQALRTPENCFYMGNL